MAKDTIFDQARRLTAGRDASGRFVNDDRAAARAAVHLADAVAALISDDKATAAASLKKANAELAVVDVGKKPAKE